MTEEAATEETPAKPEVNNEARYKAERDRAKGRLDDANTRLEALEAKLSERSAADEKAEADRRKKAGDFESLEADLNARLGTAETQNKGFADTIAAYEKRDTDRIDAILKDRKDADEIRTTFEGLPVSKQLSLAERFLNAESAPTAPTGTPGSLGGGDTVSADLQAKAEQFYPGDKEQQAIFLQQYQNVIKDKGNQATTDGWPLTKPQGGTQ